MKLDASAKFKSMLAALTETKRKASRCFVTRFNELDDSIVRRLVIENDDTLYDLNDCLKINAQIQIPILFDVFIINSTIHKTLQLQNLFSLL